MHKITSSVKTGGFLILFLVFAFSFSIGATAISSGLTVSLDNATNLTCDNSGDGSIEISVTGGDGSYNYSWSGPNSYSSTSEDISNLTAGEYTVSVTDNNGNSGGLTITVNVEDNVSPTASRSCILLTFNVPQMFLIPM